jgi:AcrR family transcriptional regulator
MSVVEPSQHRSRREERKQETRAELVAGATRVFARRGFQGASLQEIAREAGYSTGAVYWHFQGKDDLFLAVYEAQAAARVRDMESFRELVTGELPQRARAFADQFMARLTKDPEFMILSLEFLVHAWRHPPLREEFSHRISWGRIAAARLLQDSARDAGLDLPMPADDLASVLRELGTGLALAKLADPDAISDRLFGDFVQLLFERLIQPQPEIEAELPSTQGRSGS